MRNVKNIVNLFFLLLGHIIPRSQNKIVFGAWNGKSYSDNPKFLFEHLFEHPEWRIVWIGNKAEKSSLPPMPEHASFAVRHSLTGIWHAITAKTWVFSHSTNDIALIAIWGSALLIDTCHGVALKRVGEQSVSYKQKASAMERFWKMIFANKTYLIMPSSIQGKNTITSYPGHFQEPILPFGSTALDYIIKNKNNIDLIQRIRAKYASTFNLPADKKWIVYAPTFRLTRKDNFSFLQLESCAKRKLQNILRTNNAIIVEKLHPSLLTSSDHQRHEPEIYFLNGNRARLIEPQELWLAADALISDYSSCVIPFFLQNKPVVHFVYDYDFYTKSDSGLIRDLSDIRFGVIVNNIDELCNVLCNMNVAIGQCGAYAPQLIEYEKGNACEQSVAFIKEHLGIN